MYTWVHLQNDYAIKKPIKPAKQASKPSMQPTPTGPSGWCHSRGVTRVDMAGGPSSRGQGTAPERQRRGAAVGRTPGHCGTSAGWGGGRCVATGWWRWCWVGWWWWGCWPGVRQRVPASWKHWRHEEQIPPLALQRHGRSVSIRCNASMLSSSSFSLMLTHTTCVHKQEHTHIYNHTLYFSCGHKQEHTCIHSYSLFIFPSVFSLPHSFTCTKTHKWSVYHWQGSGHYSSTWRHRSHREWPPLSGNCSCLVATSLPAVQNHSAGN